MDCQNMPHATGASEEKKEMGRDVLATRAYRKSKKRQVPNLTLCASAWKRRLTRLQEDLVASALQDSARKVKIDRLVGLSILEPTC